MITKRLGPSVPSERIAAILNAAAEGLDLRSIATKAGSSQSFCSKLLREFYPLWDVLRLKHRDDF